MTARDAIALKPCPFCGGKAQVERHGDRRQSTIYACTDCGCRLETGEEWDIGAAWNRRAEPAAGFSIVPAGDVGDGWVLVPEEPTEEMTEAASDASEGFHEIDGDKGPWLRSEGYAAAYRAMLSARPKGGA